MKKCSQKGCTRQEKVEDQLFPYFDKIAPKNERVLKWLEKALKEIEKTEDNFGFYEVKGSICYVSAQSERHPVKKAKLFKEAAAYYKKDRLFSNYHDAFGWANLWEIHNPTIGLDTSIILLKKSQNHFKKADDPRGFHQSSGFLFLLKAIKEGIVQKKDHVYYWED